MKFSVERDYFLSKLLIIQKALPVKTNYPILNCIKLKIEDNKLELLATNSDITMKSILEGSEITVGEPGEIVVPGKFFVDGIKKLNSRTIDLEVVDGKILIIKSNRVEIKLNLMDKTDYPTITLLNTNNRVCIESKVFKEIISQTTFAAAVNENRPILTGVNLTINNGTLQSIATNSYRLSKKQININEGQNINLVIPNRSLDELLKMIKDTKDKNIEIIFDESQLLFIYDGIYFQSRLLEGTYPDTTRLIPTEFTLQVKFNKNELISSVERASLFTTRERDINSATIKLNVKANGTVELRSTSTADGGIVEEIYPTSPIEGDPIEIAFNPIYLSEALKSFKDSEVNLKFTSYIKPFIIVSEKDENLTQLILPMKLN